MAFPMKRGDTSPSLLMTCDDGAGNTVDISGATVRFRMTPLGGVTRKIDAVATILDGATGSLQYDWQAADTDTEGAFIAEVEVTFPNGAIETFPNDGMHRVDVNSDL